VNNRTFRLSIGFVLLATLFASFSLVAQAQIATNYGFANAAFQSTWSRTDQLIASSKVSRSWYWGPKPLSDGTREPYVEAPDGTGYRLVQYFDKGRMEINNPNGNKSNLFYVTAGLLARELIEGRYQIGNNSFKPLEPAQIPLASDLDDGNAPTYASFHNAIATTSASFVGSIVEASIARDGSITSNGTGFASKGVTEFAYEPATKHNIPDVFWRFLNTTGPVLINGKQVNARLTDPYNYATGYPISEAYWAKVKINGVQGVDVLIQVYERRVLTYQPDGRTGYKVQMGNIGHHYYEWRYARGGQNP